MTPAGGQPGRRRLRVSLVANRQRLAVAMELELGQAFAIIYLRLALHARRKDGRQRDAQASFEKDACGRSGEAQEDDGQSMTTRLTKSRQLVPVERHILIRTPLARHGVAHRWTK